MLLDDSTPFELVIPNLGGSVLSSNHAVDLHTFGRIISKYVAAASNRRQILDIISVDLLSENVFANSSISFQPQLRTSEQHSS